MDSPFPVILLILPAMFVAAIVVRLFVGSLDRQRIARYIEDRGGRVIATTWAPFGPGWLGGNKERIYEVRYVDHEGNIHHAFARTNMLAGVYFTEDHIVHRATPISDEHIETLEEENARLRAEVARLKRNRDPGSDAIQE